MLHRKRTGAPKTLTREQETLDLTSGAAGQTPTLIPFYEDPRPDFFDRDNPLDVDEEHFGTNPSFELNPDTKPAVGGNPRRELLEADLPSGQL